MEWSFVSCSASPGKDRNYPHSNTEFRIRLRHGKNVEEYSCLTDYIEGASLSREEELFFISQLHTLNVIRDKLEMMKNPLTKEELAMVSEHLFRKAQSAFSD